ncbi:hypothetical protein NH340_JMT02458 [Sarcoptes scabiei]|nr:hypothetical protein NH340_JMT02458 [Sarcoptes scabiei]
MLIFIQYKSDHHNSNNCERFLRSMGNSGKRNCKRLFPLLLPNPNQDLHCKYIQEIKRKNPISNIYLIHLNAIYSLNVLQKQLLKLTTKNPIPIQLGYSLSLSPLKGLISH